MGQGRLRNGAFWNIAIPERWGTALYGMGHFAPWENVWTDDSSGRAGRWISPPPGPAGRGRVSPAAGCLGGSRKTPLSGLGTSRLRLEVIDVYRNLDFDGIDENRGIRS